MSTTTRAKLIGIGFLLEGVCGVLLIFCLATLTIFADIPLVLVLFSLGILVVTLIHVQIGIMCIINMPPAWPTVILINTCKLYLFRILLFLSPLLILLSVILFPLLMFLSVVLLGYFLWTVSNTNFLAGPNSWIRDTEVDPFGSNLLTTNYSRRTCLITSFLTRQAGLAIYSLPLFSTDGATVFRLNREDGVTLVRVARKMIYVFGNELLNYDKRPPIAYLRNFFNDGRKLDQAEAVQISNSPDFLIGLTTNPITAIWGIAIGLAFRSLKEQRSELKLNSLNLSVSASQTEDQEIRLSEEEWLGSIFNLKGPFVAIGNPREREKEILYDYGASRIYAANHEWQEKVIKLLEDSRLIVFKIDPLTEGWGFDPVKEARRQDILNLTWWEIITATKKVPLDKIIFYLPFRHHKKEGRNYYESIRLAIAKHTTISFPARLGNNTFIELDGQGNGYGVSVFSLLKRFYLARSGVSLRHNPYILLEWILIKVRNSFMYLRNAFLWSSFVVSLPFAAIYLFSGLLGLLYGNTEYHGSFSGRDKVSEWATITGVIFFLSLLLTPPFLLVSWLISFIRSNR